MMPKQYAQPPGTDWVSRIVLILCVVGVVGYALFTGIGTAIGEEPVREAESYVGECNGETSQHVEYTGVYHAGQWTQSQAIHCNGTSMPWVVTGGARGNITMPDGATLDPNELVEWLIDLKTDKPNVWSTGNNYAVMGSEHAARQREMLSFLNQNFTDEPRPPRVKIMLTTAAEFMSRMAKAGLLPFTMLGWIPDATAANEDAEIPDGYMAWLAGKAKARVDQVLEDPAIAAEKALEDITYAIHSIQYTNDLYVWNELKREWSLEWVHMRDKGEWKYIQANTDGKKRQVANRVKARHGGKTDDWLARKTTDGDYIPLSSIEAYQRSKDPKDLFALPQAHTAHLGGIIQGQIQELLDLTNSDGLSDLFILPNTTPVVELGPWFWSYGANEWFEGEW